MQELKDKLGGYDLAINHYKIREDEVVECDECLVFPSTSFAEGEEEIVKRVTNSLVLKEYKLIVSIENIKIEEKDISAVTTKLENELSYWTSKYPEYTVVNRTTFIEPYEKTVNGRTTEGLLGIFVGNLAKNPVVNSWTVKNKKLK